MNGEHRGTILGMQLDTLGTDEALNLIISWSQQELREKYICVSNVHQCMETFDSKHFKSVINSADLVIPDSQVLVWFQKFLGFTNVNSPVRGVELMQRLCAAAEQQGLIIGLYGGSHESLALLEEQVKASFPSLHIGVSISPPFREITRDESEHYARQINQSGTQLLFVGIGCPKQEIYMAGNNDKINAVKIGVGAAFDFIAGTNKPSPAWVHPLGLEWLYRLIIEPHRLWKRYLKHNTRFLWYVIQQKFGRKFD